jgi:glycosyltransferase involved in cell wall biosynthesis
MTSASRKILYLCPCWPHEQAFGGQLRALHVGRALQQLGEVTVVVVSADDTERVVMERTAEEFVVESPVHVGLVPNRGLIQRLRWAFDPYFLNVHGCVANSEDRTRLLERLKDFDLVWILNSRTPNVLNHWHWPRSVLDVDDVPSQFSRTVWRSCAGLKEKYRAGIGIFVLRCRERFWRKRFSVLSVCSEADRQYLGGGSHVHVIPNGFPRPAQAPVRNLADPPRIGFIGLYSYFPNLEGMRWFVRECWPLVKREIPNARLRIVGKDSDGVLKPAGPDIDALGFVADSASEIATWFAMVVPVLHGAGTRIKITHAFSRKCPVVSTNLGAFGYGVQSGRELLLADDPRAFAAACVELIRDPAAASAMAERAFAAFLQKWTWDAIGPQIRAAAEDALQQAQRLTAKR